MSPFRQASSDGGLRRRGRVLAAVLAVCALAIVGRLVQLQLVEASQWRALAASVQEETLELPPRRGSILDRNGAPLAFDIKAAAIAVDGFNMTKPETLVAILVEELDRGDTEISELVYRSSYFTWIDRAVSLEVANRIEARADEAGARGLIFLDTWKRCYPQGRLASNVIGFVGTDGAGLEGIELAFDETLRGTPATLRVIEGADGRTYQTRVIDPGTPGDDVVLSLDAEIQFICEEEIEGGVSDFVAAGGMIVALDPATGEVLAMAQDEGYDLNRFRTSTTAQRKNVAVTTLFEPGSIFKVFAGLAALEADVASVSDTFDGDSGIEISGHVMHNADRIDFGTVTFAEMIEESINTAMIQVASRLGEEALRDALVAFGFGDLTGIELPGEEVGILRPAAVWSPLDLAAASIGQSVAVTGIQLARAIAVVANEGVLPDVSILAEDGNSEGLRVVSGETAATMLDLMTRVVASGTGTLAAVDGFTVAGKTGTAQKATPGRGYADEKYTSLFAGFLPAEDPHVVLLVVLDEVGTTPVSGGYTAGQIFHATATRMIHAERLASTTSDTYDAGNAPAATIHGQPMSGEALFGRP